MDAFFSGKRAVVTGAAQGMGARIATDLAKFGATVTAVDLNAAKLTELQKQVSNIIPVAVNLSDWEATKRALANIGDVDLLVNNAGITKLEAFGEIEPDSIDKIFAVNFKAAVNVSQICARSMKSRGVPGAVVNVSSQSSLVALPEHAAYCGSKAALDMLTRVMALELGPYNIRVNSVNPTVTKTAMGEAVWKQYPEKAAAMKAKIPLGRFAETKEISDVVLFLLSDMASMVTGVVLPIDGGYTAV